jgi:hypothetical protein
VERLADRNGLVFVRVRRLVRRHDLGYWLAH